ncbi:protein transport protein SEC31 [Brassica napus]|uniref:protein transport protein SEC31 n=1 Tax=Brassica napus TaxID=3708 RepID=UPI000BBEBB91|nr:protein transport protein SEC31 [Brassica napus]
MATSPSDKLVQEQEVGTEEVVDPAKTTDEEDEARTEVDEVRTEEVDPAKTTEEEDEVRTEKEETRTEDDEARTQEVDPTKKIEEEDEVRTEEEEVQTEEEEVQTEEEDEPKEEAIESLLESARNLNIEDEETNQGTENQNRQEDPITTRRSDQAMERGSTSLASDQNRRLDSDSNTSAISLSIQDQGTENQNPQEQSMIRRSGQRMERGSTSSSRDQNQNRPLVLPNPPPSAQTSRQMMMMPPRLGPSVPPYQQDPFGLPQPRWLVVDHFYSDGLGLYGALWRFRTITPFLPNQNTYPHQLVAMELPGQPGTVLVCYSQSFGVLHQGQLVPHHEAPPMRPQQQNQFRRLPPMRPMLPQDNFVVHLGQVPVRPMMYYQEQNQIVPNAGISQPPLRPSLPQLGAPMMQPPVLLYPPPIVNAVPVRPVMNQGGQRFRFPMIQQHQGSPSAPWPEQNQQLQSPRESQGSNDGPFSSGGSQD